MGILSSGIKFLYVGRKKQRCIREEFMPYTGRRNPASAERQEERKNNMATLRDLFDYQKFADNARMGELIRDTENRYDMTGADADPKKKDSSFRQSLSSSELKYINAAGIPEIWQANAEPDSDKKDMLWNKP